MAVGESVPVVVLPLTEAPAPVVLPPQPEVSPAGATPPGEATAASALASDLGAVEAPQSSLLSHDDAAGLPQIESAAAAEIQTPSRGKRILNALRTVREVAQDAYLRPLVLVQNELARRSRAGKLGAIALAGVAVGAFVATRDISAAQMVAEHAPRGQEALAQAGSNGVIHAQETAFVTATHHADKAREVRATVGTPRKAALDSVTKHGRRAVAAVAKKAARTPRQPGVPGPNAGPNVTSQDLPDNANLNATGLADDINNVLGAVVPKVILGAAPVAAGLIARGVKHRRFEREEGIAERAEHREVREHDRSGFLNDRRGGLGIADNVLAIAKGDRTFLVGVGFHLNTAGNLDPLFDPRHEEVLMNEYMNYVAHRHHNIGSVNDMLQHLRGFRVAVHKSEVVVDGSGEYHYVPQGSNGYSEPVMKRYMERHAAEIATARAAAIAAGTPPPPLPNVDSMHAFFHTMGVDIPAGRITLEPNMAARGRMEFFFNNNGIKKHAPGTNATELNAKPASSGMKAAERGAYAAMHLRGELKVLPYSANILNEAGIAAAMQDLRSTVGGVEVGLLADRRGLQAVIAHERTLPRTPLRDANILAWVTRMQTDERVIRDRVNTILGPVPKNKTSLDFFGLRGFVEPPLSGPPNFRISQLGQDPGDALVRVATMIRAWDTRP